MASDRVKLKIGHHDKSAAIAIDPLLPCQRVQKITSLTEAIAAFEKLQSHWLAAPCREQLFETIKHLQSKRPFKITKALSLTIGSTTNPQECTYNDGCRCEQSFLQLVVFIDVAKHVLNADDSNQIYSQDPEYNELDEALLEHLNVTVLDDPDAQQLADEHAFVFAPFWGADSQIRGQCRHNQPNIYIGTLASLDLRRLKALQKMEPKPSLEPFSDLVKWEELDLIIKNLVGFERTRGTARWRCTSNCNFCRALNDLYLSWADSKTTGYECTSDDWWCGGQAAIQAKACIFERLLERETVKVVKSQLSQTDALPG